MKAIIKKSQAHEPYSFSFLSADGKTLVRSENYAEKKSALNGIESVKKNCLDEKRYELNTSKDSKFYFNIKASNGQVVATSMLFSTEKDRDNAIAQLKNGASNAAVEEQA